MKYNLLLVFFNILLLQLIFCQTEKPQANYWEEYSKAMAFERHMEYDSALDYYNKALKLAAESNFPDLVAYTNRRIGSVYLQNSNYNSGKEYLKRAIDQAISIGNDTIQADAYLPYGWILTVEGKTDSALTLYNKSLLIYTSIGDTIGIAKVNSSFSIYYKNTADFKKGLETALKASATFKNSEFTEYYIRALINLGNIYEKLEKTDTALSCYELAYVLCLEYDYPKYVSDALINRGVIYYRQGRFNDAKVEFLKAIDYNIETDNIKDLALLYSNISNIYRKLEDYDKAIESAKRSLEISKEINDVACQSRALNNLGIIYKTTKEYQHAIECYLESLEIASRLKYKEDQKKALNNLSTLYELQGDYKTSLDYLHEAVDLKDIIMNEKKQKAIAETEAKYEVLILEERNRVNQMEKQQIRFERNLSFGLGITGIVLLILLVIALRNRARKNRIISAQRIQQLEDEKRILAAQSVIVGQEEERKRLAQELHDGIGVLLSTASMHFSNLSLDDDPEKTKDIYSKATKMLNEASKEVRKVSHNMMPGVLSKFGLKEAIEDLFEKVEEIETIRTEISLICSNDRLPENLEIMVYRIIQEMINNTLKHAEANEIKCNIKRDQEKITIHFSDNGKGFDAKALPHDKSLGIYGIRSRVDFLSGSVNLKSGKDSGTTYEIEIPLVQKTNRPKNK